MEIKEIRAIERIFKGCANHWRIKVILLISNEPNISLEEISEKVKGNYQTIAEHVQRLKNSGLINKKYRGKTVLHNLSPYGLKIVEIIKTFLH